MTVVKVIQIGKSNYHAQIKKPLLDPQFETSPYATCHFMANTSIIEVMSQYQKHSRNATFHRINLIATCSLLLTCLFYIPVAAKGKLTPSLVSAQQVAADAGQPLLLPVNTTAATLQTHVAEFRLNYEGSSLTVSLDARYQLRNPTDAMIAPLIKITSGATEGQQMLPGDLTVSVGDQTLPLTPAENASYTTQIQIAGRSSVDLFLNYTANLDNSALPSLNYSADLLQQWSADPSLRITLIPAPAISPESWLRTEPAGWSYTQPSESQQPGIKWLYDARIPEQPIVFQIVHPNQWQQLQAATQAATPGATLDNYMRLGEVLGQLYTAASTGPDTPENGALRERFYAQTIAAYTTGLASGAMGALPQDLAALHAGLATLYRQRSINPDGTVNSAYAVLMAEEASLALGALPPEDGRRLELVRWQAEGLTAQLKEMRNRRDWRAALQILDQLATLPPEVVLPDTLIETRRTIEVQQALQFLEQNNQAAALALAGSDITDVTLLPPPAARTLFAGWQMTSTITLEATRLELAALALPDRSEQAHAALQDLVTSWQRDETSAQGYTFELNAALDATVHTPVADSSATGSGANRLHLLISMPPQTTGLTLAQGLPPEADWDMLRTLLQQIDPQVQRESRLLRQQIGLMQTLDLRTVGDQWSAMAASLENEAAQLETQSTALNAEDAGNAENALRMRIQAANYRHAAEEWRNLSRNSWVMTTLAAPAGLQTITRSWITTPATPAQVLELQAEALNIGRLAGALVAAVVGLFLLAGTLWWLL